MTMQQLHVYPQLLGSTLVNTRGDRRRILAVWLEQMDKQTPLLLIALTVGQDGETFNVYLPDTNWQLELRSQ